MHKPQVLRRPFTGQTLPGIAKQWPNFAAIGEGYAHPTTGQDMRKTLLAFSATAATIGVSSPALAYSGYEEFSEFIVELPGSAADLLGPGTSLCHLVEKYIFLAVPVFYRSEGYVLGADHCQATTYRPLTADQFASMQALNLLPATLPAQPSLSPLQHAAPLWWSSAIGLFVLIYRRADKRQQARFAQMGNLGEATKRVLDTLCHAARAVGQTDPATLARIAEITTKLTNEPVTTEDVDRALAACLPKPKPIDFTRFAKGFSITQRQTILKALILMIGPTGLASRAGKKFVSTFVRACRLKKGHVAAVYRELADKT